MFVPYSLALLAAALFAIAMGRPYIEYLKRWKLGQIIREEGPQSHHAKAGTPSMGGWIILAPALVVTAVATKLPPEVALLSAVVLGYTFVGWLDDYLIVKKRHNKGLSAKQKLAGQILVAVGFAVGLHVLGHGTAVILPFTNGQGLLELGWFYYALLIFIMVGTTNAVNLTDGLDGLASGTVAIALAGMTLVLGTYGHFANNCHPAQVFMGDTGSLGLGAVVAGAAVMGRLEFWLIPLGAVFIVETLSVMAQVAYFKRTGGKRLLKMSPLHHHFELSGW